MPAGHRDAIAADLEHRIGRLEVRQQAAHGLADHAAQEADDPVDHRALEIPDNLDVGRHDPAKLPGIVAGMDYKDADVIVLSACVQMPSLPSIQPVEDRLGLPVLSAAVCTTHAMLSALTLPAHVPGCGALLSGRY